MLLAIDSGNTNVVFAVFGDDGKKQGEWRAATEANRTADEFGAWLEQLMARDGVTPGDIDAAIVATVVPDNLMHLQTLCSKYFDCDPLVVGSPDINLGIAINVDHPDEVGADRLCDAVAAHASYDGPLLILDFGTATTFDVVSADGSYEGGVICPGINLSLDALHSAAAQLPRVAVAQPPTVIGRSTIGQMQSGIFYGHVTMIEGMTKRICEEFGHDLTVIATGGLAGAFSSATGSIHHADPDLTLRGLLIIHQLNQTK
ncbi:MAG: type III pantothenate kinase [Proteobacteria bacterium]|nr:type III pantothenate kinase [Pseudomonadota bacterium]